MYTWFEIRIYYPSEPLLHAYLGKWGDVLWSFANGYDQSPVAAPTDEAGVIKSIGNSTIYNCIVNRDRSINGFYLMLVFL